MFRVERLSGYRVLSLAAAAALVASGCGATAPATRAVAPERLVFASGSVDTRIRTIDSTGAGARELTRHRPSGTEPAWALSGRAVTFAASDGALWLMSAQGSGARRIASDPEWSALSPEGRRVATLIGDGSLIVTTASAHVLLRVRVLRGAGDFEAPPSWSPDGRRVAFYTYTGVDDEFARIGVVELAHRSFRMISPPRAYDTDPTWSPDGTRIAFEAGSASSLTVALEVMNRDGNDRVRLATRLRAEYARPSWSPDGRWLAFQRTTRHGERAMIEVVGSAGAPERLVASTRQPSTATPVWSPDSRQLAFASASGIAVALLDGRVHQVSRLGVRWSLSWAPGKRILFSDGDAIRTIDAGGQTPSTLTRVLNDVSPVWSPRGDRIAFVRGPYGQGSESTAPADEQIWVVGANGRGARRVGAGSAPSWSPDGRQLVYNSRVGGRTVIVVQTIGTSRQRVIATGTTPSWSPTGSSIAFLSGNRSDELHIVSANGGGEHVLLRSLDYAPPDTYAFERYAFRPAWSPDGSAVAVAADLEDDEGQVHGAYVRVGKLTGQTWKVGRAAETGLDWSPDGRRLVGAGYDDVVWTAPADGTAAPRTIASGSDDSFRDPSWSADGTQVAYTHCRSDTRGCRLEIVRTDGTQRRRLLELPLPAAISDNPPLGPDWRP